MNVHLKFSEHLKIRCILMSLFRFLLFFESGPCYVVQAGLELQILLLHLLRTGITDVYHHSLLSLFTKCVFPKKNF
jgi:hypothetical protein